MNFHSGAVTCSNPVIPVFRFSRGNCLSPGDMDSAQAVSTISGTDHLQKEWYLQGAHQKEGEQEGKAALFLDSRDMSL